MGTEIVFVLIVPEVLVCLPVALLLWLSLVKTEKPTTAIAYVNRFSPLIIGLVVSMTGLALLTYIEGEADFTWLVAHGYYTEPDRAIYLPRRLVGRAIVKLVFVLPPMCFVVIPCTARLLRRQRLTMVAIALRIAIGWLTLSLIGWLFDRRVVVPSYPLSAYFESTVIPVLIYGLPIPLAALLFWRLQWLRPAPRVENHRGRAI